MSKRIKFAIIATFVLVGVVGFASLGRCAPPKADFYYYPNLPYTMETVFFWDNSTDEDGDINSWQWDFGDGETANGSFVQHIYEKAGVYNVTHIVWDSEGNYSSKVIEIHVRNRVPIAEFYWTKENKNIIFDASYSYDIDGEIVSYLWDFGDGSIGYGEIAGHEYAEDGEYNVSLRVYDDDGESSVIYREIDTLNKIPLADFSYEPLPATDLDIINFTSNCQDLDGNITNITWDFDDGSFAYGAEVSHKYDDDGMYNVKIMVYDNDGAYNYTTKNVIVYNVEPVAIFTWQPSYVTPHINTLFDASLSYDLDGYIANYTWNFGDGSIDYGETVTHNYTDEGIYNVTLIVRDDDGAYSIAYSKILVADIYVDANYFDPANHVWDKIQDAVDNATDNDFIYVKYGVYNEDVSINKRVRIVGENSVVNGEIFSFNIEGNEVSIKNFTINGSYYGVILNSNQSEITNCTFIGNEIGINILGDLNNINTCSVNSNNISILISGCMNYVMNGIFNGKNYGVYLSGDDNFISQNSFSGGYGYGIYIEGENNNIKNNYISNSIFGVYLLKQNAIEDNIFDTCSHGIKLDAFSVINYNLFINNYYGIYSTSSFVLLESEFINNDISIMVNNGIPTIKNASINGGDFGIKIKNGKISQSNIEGANVGVEIIENVELKNSRIENCSVGVMGGGNAKIISCQFINNEIGIDEITGNVTDTSFNSNHYGVKGENLEIFNNTFNENEYGIWLIENTTVKSCYFNNNNIGIYTFGDKNEIISNYFTENIFSINLESSYNHLLNNYLSNNTYGIKIIFSPLNNLSGNIMENNSYNFDIEGSKLFHFYQKIDYSNLINGKNVSYLINETDLKINEGYGFLAFISCNNLTAVNLEINHNGKGILIIYSQNISIEDCTLSKNLKGIYALKSENLTMKNVVAEDNVDGISSKSSKNVEIINSTFTSNSKGISLFDVEKRENKVIIKNSEIKSNEIGINLENIIGLSIYEATIEKNVNGIRIYNSNLTIINSEIENKYGINSTKSNLNILFTNLSNILSIYANEGEIFMENCIINNSSIGIKASHLNLTIQNSSLNKNEECLILNECNLNISSSIFNKNKESKINSSKIEILNSSFVGNEYGINITQSDGLINISIFSNNTYSLIIENSLMNILNSTFYENEYAVMLNSSHNLIKGGKYYSNLVAIKLTGGENLIDKVLFHHNNWAGILINSSYNVVLNCSFWKNFYGIIAYGENNTIYHNNFVYNIENAIDYGNNLWNISYPDGGNYWHDYAGEDYLKGKNQNESGSDGIGDIPYQFSGNKDNYPLMNKFENASSIPNEAPVASFYFYPTEPFSFDEIIFVDSSYDENGKSDIVSWHWDFGDGNTSDERNPKHTYEKAGLYNVTLIIEDESGENSSFKMEINVRNLPPFANFSWNPENISSYTVVTFDASLSYDLDGYITNYTWDFGDGSVGYGEKITYKYKKSGIYIVRMTVLDNAGNESYVEKEIFVNNRKPTANFIFIPDYPKTGEKINFTDLSNDLDGEIKEWKWDFGDGSISYERNPVHEYKESGEYVVKLVVKDDEGAKGNYTAIIKVKKSEVPSFEIFILTIAFAFIILNRRKKFK
ncbi:MAG TPA: PKD domain-containing protein [Thermoplasmatales archaeon]|nr:PKD domain-containing protein [Thermoplasmatales archaeon]